MKVRKEVKKFSEAMEWQLQRNDHKGHWKPCTYDFLLRELDRNLIEIKSICKSPGGCLADIRENLKIIKRRTANVANFCMMIADNCGALNLPFEKCFYYTKAKDNKEKECDSDGLYGPECEKCPYCKI